MPYIFVPCPFCGSKLRAPPLAAGTSVKCPRCDCEFPLPSEEDARPGRPIGFVVETDPETGPARPSRPLRRDSRDEFEPFPVPREEESRPLPDSISINLTLWMKYASAHSGAILGPAIGYLLLSGLIAVVSAGLPRIGVLGLILLCPPLWAGLPAVCLAQLKGRDWAFANFFSGFSRWIAFLLSLLISVVCLLLAAGLAMLLYYTFLGALPLPNTFYLTVVALALPPMIYLQIRFFFVTPLILDRGLGLAKAISVSWRLTRRHILSLFFVGLVLFFINLIGAMLLGIGLLFTLPFTTLVRSAGYLLVAGSRPPVLPHGAGPVDER